MKDVIYDIPVRDYVASGVGTDITDEFLGGSAGIEDYKGSTAALKASATLRKRSVEDILEFFETLAVSWIESRSPFLATYSSLGISFLLSFMRRSNLEPMVKASFKNNIEYLDRFVLDPALNKQLMAHPRGVVTHWLAGNVPILGMISLIQGILAKNINVVKLPRQNGLVLPSLMDHIRRHKTAQISGEEVIACVRLLYCNKDDAKGQRLLSDVSNVRVAWGGLEAVESVLAIPKKYGVEDVIFGPKYSFCAIGRDSLSKELVDDIGLKLALDASIFDQHGCNSPHVVFLERGGSMQALELAEALARGMEKALKRIPKAEVSSGEAYKIVETRSEYALEGRVFQSKGTEWTVVLMDGLRELPTPCFSRVLFVTEVDDLFDVVKLISHRNQTLGLLLDDERRASFAEAVTAAGIERITNVGKMSLFSYPWDGMFPMERFVRWTSLE